MPELVASLANHSGLDVRNPGTQSNSSPRFDPTAALHDTAVVNIDASDVDEQLADAVTSTTVFVGCELGRETQARVKQLGALSLPQFRGLPFNPFRTELYQVPELYGIPTLDAEPANRVVDSTDARIFAWADHLRWSGAHLIDTLAMRIHDASIDDAFARSLGKQTVFAVMGGHRLPRNSSAYREVAIAAWRLAQFPSTVILSGGGPGAMEAANLGARAAPLSLAALVAAIKDFSVVSFIPPVRTTHHGWRGGNASAWLDDAYRIRDVIDQGQTPSITPDRLPDIQATAVDESDSWGTQSIAVPTWFYGHEPTNVFGQRIAKYFANSIREDGLLAVATGGVLFAEGGPGTLQEVFQDAAQNAYATFGPPSPMVFLDVDGGWSVDRTRSKVLDALRSAAGDASWGRAIFVANSGAEAAEVLHTAASSRLRTGPEQQAPA